MPPSPDVFEKLATFYLGRRYDLDAGKVTDDLLLYDAKDLCTHAMCVGMTGSGKTGLCLAMLEEAAIDGIPAICIDPKGDLANLCLAFPELKADDFRPWLEPREAERKGMTLDDFATSTAKKWREGLAEWGQTPERIARFKQSVDVAIYTPGSNIGLPLTVLQSFDCPPPAVLADADAMRERVTGASSGLLTLLGIDADPLLSREHILISSILDHSWRAGRNVSIGHLIGLITSPPITRVGVLDLETFMPTADRSKLAMMLNNLVASPAFASWLEGESLSIDRLLHTPEGKPRLTILSIAHLNDQQRMFFVTILLNELIAWMRTQSGTGSLRAMLYMDEVAGYFPPVSNPPSKPPMLTLLKQARAFGLGVTLATQNPVDLDYKGLSNIGTWFLGRLQTERDKARVIEGLEGAATQAGQPFDRGKMERLLASLGSRVFLMNNVHDDAPTVFQSRWAMSFLAGPLARDQISRLMADRKTVSPSPQCPDPVDAPEKPMAIRPVVPPGIEEIFLVPTTYIPEGTSRIYRPGVMCEASLHFVRASSGIDQWLDVRRMISCVDGVPADLWESSLACPADQDWTREPDPDFSFADLPDGLRNASNVKAIGKQFADYLYRHHSLELYRSELLDQTAPPGMSESDARLHFRQAMREKIDEETRKLRDKYSSKLSSMEAKVRDAEQRAAQEAQQYEAAKVDSMVSVGASIVGAFMGRKWVSSTNVSKMSTAAKKAARVTDEKADMERAESTRIRAELDLRELETDLRRDIMNLSERLDIENLELTTVAIPSRKSDLKVSQPKIVWMTEER